MSDLEKQIEAARKYALRRLDQRAQSRYELEQYLKKKGIDDQAIKTVVDRFIEVGLIDDAKYAQMWVETRQQSRGLAAYALARELRQKGIDEYLIEDALTSISRESEFDMAMKLATAKAASNSGKAKQVVYRRLAGQLARKGYSPSIISQVLGVVLQEWPQEEIS